MDAVIEVLVDSLLSQGPFGVIIVGMGGWIWKQQQVVNRVQEQRVQDVFKLAEAAHTFSNALDRNTAMLKALMED